MVDEIGVDDIVVCIHHVLRDVWCQRFTLKTIFLTHLFGGLTAICARFRDLPFVLWHTVEQPNVFGPLDVCVIVDGELQFTSVLEVRALFPTVYSGSPVGA